MSLTKKHFLKIAEIVSRLTYTQACDGYKYISVSELVKELSDFFQKENGNFKADKFKEACYKE